MKVARCAATHTGNAGATAEQMSPVAAQRLEGLDCSLRAGIFAVLRLRGASVAQLTPLRRVPVAKLRASASRRQHGALPATASARPGELGCSYLTCRGKRATADSQEMQRPSLPLAGAKTGAAAGSSSMRCRKLPLFRPPHQITARLLRARSELPCGRHGRLEAAAGRIRSATHPRNTELDCRSTREWLQPQSSPRC